MAQCNSQDSVQAINGNQQKVFRDIVEAIPGPINHRPGQPCIPKGHISNSLSLSNVSADLSTLRIYKQFDPFFLRRKKTIKVDVGLSIWACCSTLFHCKEVHFNSGLNYTDGYTYLLGSAGLRKRSSHKDFRTLHHSKGRPFAAVKATPEYEYRSTISETPSRSLASIRALRI